MQIVYYNINYSHTLWARHECYLIRFFPARSMDVLPALLAFMGGICHATEQAVGVGTGLQTASTTTTGSSGTGSSGTCSSTGSSTNGSEAAVAFPVLTVFTLPIASSAGGMKMHLALSAGRAKGGNPAPK